MQNIRTLTDCMSDIQGFEQYREETRYNILANKYKINLVNLLIIFSNKKRLKKLKSLFYYLFITFIWTYKHHDEHNY